MKKILHISNSNFDVNTVYPNSKLISKLVDNVNQLLSESEYHTSLGDLSTSEIIYLSKDFDIINFVQDEFDKNSEIFHYTIVLLAYLSHFKEVTNFTTSVPEKFLELDVHTRGSDPTLWVFGCSHSCGTGLLPGQQHFASHLSQSLKMPLKLMAKGSTSTQWSLRHLINANIQPNDIVIWQITTPVRFSWMTDRLQEIILHQCKDRQLVDVWQDQQTNFYHFSLLNHGVQYLRAKKIKFAVTSLLVNADQYVDFIKEYVKYPEYCYAPILGLDMASDNMHYGPLTHKALAQHLEYHLQCTNDKFV